MTIPDLRVAAIRSQGAKALTVVTVEFQPWKWCLFLWRERLNWIAGVSKWPRWAIRWANGIDDRVATKHPAAVKDQDRCSAFPLVSPIFAIPTREEEAPPDMSTRTRGCQMSGQDDNGLCQDQAGD